MPAPAAAAIAVGALKNPRRTRNIALVVITAIGVSFILLMGVLGAIFGLEPPQSGGYGPSSAATAQIPSAYLELYQQAGQRYGVDPWILAAIGRIETDHGRSTAPGVRAGVNAFGCCAGPMQFSVIGSPSTWDTYGVDGNDDGTEVPYDPADAIPAAARYLRASGAPTDYHRAIFAYNHAEWYVADVLAQADAYRGAATTPAATGDSPAENATVRELLTNPRIILTAGQRADFRAGGIEPRLIATLAWIGRPHTVIITALRRDHYPGTNHEKGRAMDIGAVDGEVCRGTRSGRCATLARELAALHRPTRSTELIYCWDPDPPDPGMFARADHGDHIHWGMDG